MMTTKMTLLNLIKFIIIIGIITSKILINNDYIRVFLVAGLLYIIIIIITFLSKLLIINIRVVVVFSFANFDFFGKKSTAMSPNVKIG